MCSGAPDGSQRDDYPWMIVAGRKLAPNPRGNEEGNKLAATFFGEKIAVGRARCITVTLRTQRLQHEKHYIPFCVCTEGKGVGRVDARGTDRHGCRASAAFVRRCRGLRVYRLTVAGTGGVIGGER